jgi:hypothetical protein
VVKHPGLTTSAERLDALALGTGVDPERSLLGNRGLDKKKCYKR